MKKELTSRESKVIQWIKQYQQENGGYPTYREIQGALGFNSINSVSQYIKQLAVKGYLELIKNKGYRLGVEERPAFVNLSLMGSIQAGSTNISQENPETVVVPQQWVSSPQKSFLLKVRGNSMEDAGIHEGDMVVVDSSKKAILGDVIVALVDGETTVKRLAQKNGKNYLKAESKQHPDIHPEGAWEIQGVVKSLIRQY